MTMKTELLLGAGKRPYQKRMHLPNESAFIWEGKLFSLDINPGHKPDIVFDLNNYPLPFENDSIDSIYMFDILEHLNVQGEFIDFFAEFTEYWRILKPDGHLLATVPYYLS